MYLLRLDPEQISNNWELINSSIKEHVKDQRLLARTLTALSNGTMQAWVGVQDTADTTPTSWIGVVITCVVFDPVACANTLLVAWIKAFKPTTDQDWLDGLSTLNNYARENNCITVSGYVDRDSFVNKLSRYGVRGGKTLVYKEVI